MTSKPPSTPRRSHWTTAAAAVAALLLGGIVVVSCVPTGGGLRLHATTLETNASLSSATSTSGSTPLRTSRIALVVVGDHPLMEWAAPLVAERLRKLGAVEEVEVVEEKSLREAAARLPGGSPLPDLFVVLRLQGVSVEGFSPTGRTVDATVGFHVGPTLLGSTHHRHDPLSPPGLRLSVDGTLHHQSETTGFESADARYEAAGTSLGESLAEGIAKILEGELEEHGPPRALPPRFVPAYRPVPADLPLPPAADAALTRLTTGNGVLTPNQTLWLAATANPAKEVDRLRQALVDAGWSVTDHDPGDADGPASLHAERGPELFEAFQPRHPRDAETRASPEDGLVLLYTLRSSEAETRALFPPLADATLAELEALDPLSRRMSAGQRQNFHDQLRARLARGEPLSADATWRLAEALHAEGQEEAALRAATRAWWLFRIAGSDDRGETLGESVAEWSGQAGGDRWEAPPLDEDAAASLGFATIGPGDTAEAVLPPGTPLVLRLPADGSGDGGRLFAATVTPAGGADGPRVLTLVETSRGFLSRQALTPAPNLAPAVPWSAEASTGAGGLRLRVTAQERGGAGGEPAFSVVVRAEASGTQPPG